MSELTSLLELLGTDATLALIEAHGGTRLSVPRSAGVTSELREQLGVSGFGRLVEYFGGSVLTIPLARAWRAPIYRARGMTHKEIARRCGVVESSVYKILADPRAGQRQRGRAIGARIVPGQQSLVFD